MYTDKNESTSKAIYHCADCGNPLYDGDTAYSLLGTKFCAGCVERSLIVCREPEDEPEIFPTYTLGKHIIAGIPHREIKFTAKPSLTTRERMTEID